MIIEEEKYVIEYLGKKFKTIHYHKLNQKQYDAIREMFWRKPDFEDVKKQMLKLKSGGSKNNHIHKYYFYDIASECKLKGSKWSIKEFMDSNDLISFAIGKVRNNSDFYKSAKTLDRKLEAVLRLSPSGTAAKLSNFPLKTALSVLDKYNVNNNYYDFSCGWGVRLSASMIKDINYFGTDPNIKLHERLEKFGKDFIEVTNSKSKIDIRCQGSEKYIPEWENKIGLAFSSPPYFDLEDYKVGDQSIKNRNYKRWLEEYWEQTVKNIKKYLVSDGYFLLNIKNIKGFNLYDDMKEIIENNGFQYIESLELKNINRVFLAQHNKHTNEEILVFKNS
jgi:hypothetical protein